MVTVFQQKKLFYHQRTKKSWVIGEAKAKFVATIVNWYKYQLVDCSKLLKIKKNILIKIIYLPSIKKFKLFLYFYYCNELFILF